VFGIGICYNYKADLSLEDIEEDQAKAPCAGLPLVDGDNSVAGEYGVCAAGAGLATQVSISQLLCLNCSTAYCVPSYCVPATVSQLQCPSYSVPAHCVPAYCVPATMSQLLCPSYCVPTVVLLTVSQLTVSQLLCPSYCVPAVTLLTVLMMSRPIVICILLDICKIEYGINLKFLREQ